MRLFSLLDGCLIPIIAPVLTLKIMFWGDKIVDEFLASHGEIAKERALILRDEKTLSGRPHVGSLRSFVMHATFSDILEERGVDHHFYYEINDTDAFDAVPPYVPAEWKEHLGKRLMDVPAPDGESESYAMQFAKEYCDMTVDAGYRAEFYQNSKRYVAGEYDKYIKLALDHKDDIREIYRTVSGSEKPETWYPCQVICDGCGRIATTKVTGWDGEEVNYSCSHNPGYAEGCGHEGKKSPFGGNATLPWKVEWAAKFAVVGVDLEGAGKDHYAAGGSRHVSNRICEEIFKVKHPFDVRHEFILLTGGEKMSSSSGQGATAVGVYELLPRNIFRFMMVQKDVMKTISFDVAGDTMPVLFDQYDDMCRNYFSEEDQKEHKKRIFEITHYPDGDLQQFDRYLPRFSMVAFFVQIPFVDIYEKFEEMKGSPLTDADKAELDLRVEYAKKWLETCSPEKFIFKIQDEVPEEAKALDEVQKEFLHGLGKFLADNPEANGEEIQGYIHDQKRAMEIEPKTIFEAIYLSILGRDSGPKAGWLMEALDKDFLVKRFSEV